MERIGVDESGKGDYFGYLVVAGAYVDDISENKLRQLRVKDSKLLDDIRIKKLVPLVKKTVPWTTVSISPERYNELYTRFKNLNKLLSWAHARVIENMLEKQPCQTVIVDKFAHERFLTSALFEKGRAAAIVQRPNGERDIAVAAASVIARAEFLATIRRLSRTVCFSLPKGATHVMEAAQQFITLHGREHLTTVAKLHFKTTKRI